VDKKGFQPGSSKPTDMPPHRPHYPSLPQLMMRSDLRLRMRPDCGFLAVAGKKRHCDIRGCHAASRAASPFGSAAKSNLRAPIASLKCPIPLGRHGGPGQARPGTHSPCFWTGDGKGSRIRFAFSVRAEIRQSILPMERRAGFRRSSAQCRRNHQRVPQYQDLSAQPI